MRYATALALVIAGTVLGFALGSATNRAAARAEAQTAPAGLTSYGRRVWNLEALLYDTFGGRARNVWLHYGRTLERPRDFSLRSTALCCGGYFLFTFANARRSEFQALRVNNPPRPIRGASGGLAPLTVRGRYISCGAGGWLYVKYGNGPANFQIDCVGAR